MSLRLSTRHSALALRMLQQEVAGLLRRMALVRPFSLSETMVPAAAPAKESLLQIDTYLSKARQDWAARTQSFARWLTSEHAQRLPIHQIYRRYVFLRLQANSALAQFDLFSDAITQRSEPDTGVWLAGLDALAQDALALDHPWFRPVPMLCYLDTGIGAAIRRTRTRMPGGGENPVALIKLPRERMVGLGLAGSLVHEVGHQGAALLDLVADLRRAMEPQLLAAKLGLAEAQMWRAWHRWISEIVADAWAVSRLGITATLGIMNVVSLPPVFVFRANLDDPHPTPWIRVILSAALGQALYPHPQWQRLVDLWQAYYPQDGIDAPTKQRLQRLKAHAPIFAQWILNQPIAAAHGASLGKILRDPQISPEQLEEGAERLTAEPKFVHSLRPCQSFALMGYVRMNRAQGSTSEVPVLSQLLTRWALKA